MRRFWVYMGLLGMLACGVKGPPRPPKSKAEAGVQVPAVPKAATGEVEEAQQGEEENLQLEEEFP